MIDDGGCVHKKEFTAPIPIDKPWYDAVRRRLNLYGPRQGPTFPPPRRGLPGTGRCGLNPQRRFSVSRGGGKTRAAADAGGTDIEWIESVISDSLVAGIAAGFLLNVCLRRRSLGQGSPWIANRLQAHFAPSPLNRLTVTDRKFPFRVRPDLQRAVDRVRYFCGIMKEYAFSSVGFSILLHPD